MQSANVKVLIWMNMPSHHQSAFFEALRKKGVDLKVFYYEKVSEDRKKLGWNDPVNLPIGEQYIKPDLSIFSSDCDLTEYIHIVPGYGASFLRKLVTYLIKNKMNWLHWSEPARVGLRWYLSYPRKRLYAHRVNKYSMGALAISEMARVDFIRWGINPKKIFIHNYSVDGLVNPADKVDRKSFGISDNQVVFIFLGVLCKRKATDILLKAFSQHLIKHADSFLLMVGQDTRPKYYNRLIDRLGIGSSILHLDSVQSSEIAKYLSLSDVLVLPSRFDGWGMVLNEAASMGLPLISTNKTGSSYHLIIHEKNGLVIEAGSSVSLEHALNYYADNKQLIIEHGKASLVIFEKHTPSISADKFVNIISKLNVVICN